MSTSQNGWPALAADSNKLHPWIIGDSCVRLRNGSAGFLLAHLALWFDQALENIDGQQLDDWGYAYRPVRGYSATLSNHSSGTAIDLNSLQHPLGAVDTFTTRQRLKLHQRLHLYKGTIRWGGDYRGRKDQMHFEINASLGACELRARQLLDTPRGRRILADNPGQRAVILS